MSLVRDARFRLASLLALALILLPVVLAGCNVKSGGFIISKPAHVRFFNALVEGGSINVTIGDNAVLSGLPFEGLTSYEDIDSGNREVKISVAGGTSTIVDSTILFTDDASSTYLIYGTSAAPVAQQISDTTTDADGGQFLLRVTNAAYGSEGFDVYVTPPGTQLDNTSPNISNVPYAITTAFGLFAAGSYQLRMTLPNSKQVIYDAGTLTFNERASYFLVVYTKGSSTLVNAALLNIDTAGDGSIVNNKLAQFKVVHAAPGTAAINAFVDGSVAFANIPYQGASSYEVLSAGPHTVTVETVTAPGAVIAQAQPPFAPATDTSIVVTGLPGAQTALVFADNNLPGTTGSARMRVVNVAPGLGAVDVLINFAKRVSGLATNGASSYIELVEDTYIVNFDLADTTTIVLNMPSVSVTAGRTYTLYLMGTPGALTGVLTRDD